MNYRDIVKRAGGANFYAEHQSKPENANEAYLCSGGFLERLTEEIRKEILMDDIVQTLRNSAEQLQDLEQIIHDNSSSCTTWDERWNGPWAAHSRSLHDRLLEQAEKIENTNDQSS